jgi:Fe-S cluster assembly iron-binding protein IscA
MTKVICVVNIDIADTVNNNPGGQKMITVTERAKEELGRLLAAKVDWPGARLRLVAREEGQLGLGIDIQQDNDRVIEHNGSVLLVVDDGLADSLTQITLDVDESPDGPELVICE